MITREFNTLKEAYIGVVDELAYTAKDVLKWGVCVGFREPLEIRIKNLLEDDDLELGHASYTKSRWTRFLRRYCREDLPEWVDRSLRKLQKYPTRPFVCSYDVNHDTKHNYGGCLASLQFRIHPEPTVLLYSRACHFDKVGFLDISFMHVVAKRLGLPQVSGQWIISLPYISAISQIFYMKMFEKPMEGHRLRRTLQRLVDVPYEDIKFGPLMRGRKRMMSLDELGYIPRSVAISKLTIEPKIFTGGKGAPPSTVDPTHTDECESCGAELI